MVGTSNAWWHGSVGRAHRSHRWGRWFESNCHHHESGRRSSSTLTGFFCVPLRVRTFRSQEYALFCQRGTQKGCADHLKTAYPCKRLVHINQCPLVRITSDISYQQVSRQIGIHRTLYVGSQILRHVCSAFFTVIRFIPAFFIQTHPSRIVIPHEEHA